MPKSGPRFEQDTPKMIRPKARGYRADDPATKRDPVNPRPTKHPARRRLLTRLRKRLDSTWADIYLEFPEGETLAGLRGPVKALQDALDRAYEREGMSPMTQGPVGLTVSRKTSAKPRRRSKRARK